MKGHVEWKPLLGIMPCRQAGFWYITLSKLHLCRSEWLPNRCPDNTTYQANQADAQAQEKPTCVICGRSGKKASWSMVYRRWSLGPDRGSAERRPIRPFRILFLWTSEFCLETGGETPERRGALPNSEERRLSAAGL